ncbi:MAG TPA: hypothetical protein VGY91_07540 [Chthoniobacterales bacterium]|jgi:hypothetical protein|nr:hypothetical protein [Chthoniobacterales bacterium]
MITLTPENSKGITKLGAFISWTPDELANDLFYFNRLPTGLLAK